MGQSLSKFGGRLFKALGVSAAAVALTIPASSVAFADTRDAIVGTLMAPNGTALAGVQIYASVETTAQQLPDAPVGTVSVPTVVGSAVTDASGNFTVPVTDLAAVRQASDSDGIASVILSGDSSSGHVYFRTQTVLSASGDLTEYRQQAASATVGAKAGRSSVVAAAAGRVPHVRLVALPILKPRIRKAATGGKSAAADIDPTIKCSGNYSYYKKVGTSGRNVTLLNQATAAKTTGTFKYETSKETSLEVGLTGPDDAFVGSVGMSKGKTVSGSLELPISKNTNAEWYIGYDFDAYDLWCGNLSTGFEYNSGYTEWRPSQWDGGGARRSWTPFTCNASYRSTIGEGGKASYANNVTTTKTGSFGIGKSTALNMKLTQTWSGTQTVTYEAVDKDTSYVICGDGKKYINGPARTRQV
jgi:hypothetical protein